jgi:hypothetical protein
MKKIFFAFLFSLPCYLPFNHVQATTRKVLFLGNSFIYTNNLPLVLQNFATAMGDTLLFDQNTIGGYTLQMHSVDTTSISKIFSQHWDIVVLQEQSQLPAFPPAQVDTTTYPYAHILDSMVHANDSCTRTMFMMTWGYENGDTSNCASWPPVCTYAGMQLRLRQSYLQMGQDNAALVAPVGAAWEVVRDSFPAINMYISDLHHPAMPGTYLAAAVFYASIYHKSPEPCSYTAGLALSDATQLKHAAKKVTLDSLSLWQQYGHYPYAQFSYTQNGNTISTHNQAVGADSYSWNFGDGQNSNADSVTHNYAAGTYIMRFTAATACFTETITDTLYISPSGVNAIYMPGDLLRIVNAGSGSISIIPQNNGSGLRLELFDMSGRRIRNYEVGGRIDDTLIPGIYLYRVWNGSTLVVAGNKLSVY